MSSKEQNSNDEQISQESEIEQGQQLKIAPENIDVVDPRDELITKLEAALMQAQQRELDNSLRAKAEIENIRRRSKQDIEKAHKFSLERFVFELLPVIDNLERTLDMLDKSNTELVSMIKGIELTYKSLLDAVRKFGLDVVCNTYVPFNPEIHQAMTILESEEYEPNQVIIIMQKGYTLNGRLIRPAMVAVSKMKS